MRDTLLCLAAFASLLTAPAVHSQISADPGGGIVTCETQAGKFKQRAITGLGQTNRMTGRIRLVTPSPSARWVPAAGFLFNAPNDRNAGVQIALSPDEHDVMLVGLRLPGQPRLIQLGGLPANRWIPLSVSLDGDGLMIVTVGSRVERRRVRLRGPIEPVLHCNSGTFEFGLGPGLALADPAPE